ncbi:MULTISPECIES: DUF3037 domain-containing protein [Catenuloplanes]|uniref:DUF3037 domain-containing protein n=1 Tax=Catenuloplanes niger TaxID=587534 RepID=A0AAE4CTA4_9ACTN|nr:DUF3037 domain-containing protein [Catenuloplanes niger]MDR7323875.1 hypothetical protein [Catenuloplanes niger]
MSDRQLFEYAVVRVLPRVERGEQINVGVILYCQRTGFLAARTQLDLGRLHALDRTVDADAVLGALRSFEVTTAGDAVCGPASRMRPGERFRWLTAPRSTIIQTGPVHTGLTADPAAELERLMDVLVR